MSAVLSPAAGGAPAAPPHPRHRRRRLALPVLAGVLLVALVVSAGIGAFPIAPAAVLGVLLDTLGAPAALPFTEQQEAVLITIRLPRVLLAAVVGASLAVSGAVLQGLFRNPLADPALIGVSSGAALFAAGAIVLSAGPLAGVGSALGGMLLPLAAFGGGLLATLLIYNLARRDGATALSVMLLAGIALSNLALAGIGLFSHLSTDEQLRNITFWMFGSLASASWPILATLVPTVAVGAIVLLRLAAPLDALALGESEAAHLGVSTQSVKRRVVVCSALLVGALTAVTGIIGFIGLIAPHMVRLALGPSHRLLLPAAALTGAILVVAADSVARVVVAPAELPLGVLTAFVGAPVFLALLARSHRSGGWA
jgi:iron complex transport system permease protein